MGDAASFIQVESIWQKDPVTLAVDWNDGKTQEFNVVELRRRCPCATCVDEVSGKRLLAKEAVSEGIRPRDVRSIGRYALAISFDDGHTSGIYSYDYLRRFSDEGVH